MPGPTLNFQVPNDDVAKRLLGSSFCLWVGAGVGLELVSGTGQTVPGWMQLVKDLESKYGLSNGDTGLSAPQRLSCVQDKCKRAPFQRELRTRIAIPLAKAFLRHLEAWAQTKEMPEVLDQFALFGAFSSSVINFNIETITSRLLAASSPYNLKVFHPPDEGSSGYKKREGRYPGQGAGYLPLNIIHPHGAIDASGRCIMTQEEYRLLNGTLGLEVAVHSCLEDNVLIMGMSLGDEYLRAQLEKFRRQIRQVFWVRLKSDEQDPKLLDWAKANGVQVVVYDTPQDMWKMFSRWSDPREASDLRGLYMARVANQRQSRVARQLVREINSIASIAFDLSPQTYNALQALRGPSPSVGDAARFVWGSDLGEDPARPGKLSQAEESYLNGIIGPIEDWAKQHEKIERDYEARFND